MRIALPPSSPTRSFRPLHAAQLALLGSTLALGGCLSRNASDVTGSIGQQRAMSAEQWRAESQSLGARYEANPNDRGTALAYARSLRALDQNAQATAVLQAAVIKFPNDTELLGAYGRSLADTGRLKEAQDVLARAHSPERPDWRILSVQGTVADQLGEHEGARQYYEAALKIVPGEPSVLSNLGLSYALSKRLPEAERVLRQASQHAKADARVRQNLVLVLGLQGRFGEAEQVAQRDQGPAEAAATVADLKRMVGQPNSWDMLRGKPAGSGKATAASGPDKTQGPGKPATDPSAARPRTAAAPHG